MSGHNKWSQIKHKKEVVDGKRSKLFSGLVKTIQLEARKAGGDRSAPGLKVAIERARTANMPNENIDRAVKTATEVGAENLEEVLYEAYGPGGIAIIITAITDNNNRTNQEIKHLLSEYGGALTVAGGVMWAFEKKGGVWQAKIVRPPLTESVIIEQFEKLITALEEHSDVERVISDISPETNEG